MTRVTMAAGWAGCGCACGALMGVADLVCAVCVVCGDMWWREGRVLYVVVCVAVLSGLSGADVSDLVQTRNPVHTHTHTYMHISAHTATGSLQQVQNKRAEHR